MSARPRKKDTVSRKYKKRKPNLTEAFKIHSLSPRFAILQHIQMLEKNNRKAKLEEKLTNVNLDIMHLENPIQSNNLGFGEGNV